MSAWLVKRTLESGLAMGLAMEWVMELVMGWVMGLAMAMVQVLVIVMVVLLEDWLVVGGALVWERGSGSGLAYSLLVLELARVSSGGRPDLK